MPDSIPTLNDILLVVVLLVPGFVSFIIIKKLAVIESKFSELETTAISLMLSLINYIPFAFITNLSDLEKLRNSIFDWHKLILLLSFIPVVGLGVGGLLRVIFRQEIGGGSVWTHIFRRSGKKGKTVIVTTADNTLYKGFIKSYSESKAKEEKELVISHPYKIIRDSGKLTDVELWDDTRILFLDKDIKRIMFLDYPKKVSSVRNFYSPFKDFIENNFLVIVILTLLSIAFINFTFILVTSRT